MEASKDKGIVKTYIRLLHDVYKRCKSRITLHSNSDKKGIQHGDTVSPKMFTAFFEWMFDLAKERLRMDREYLSHLRFEDDLI